ncbi:MAG: 2,3-bisphosphoglycerate-independent phosphoglycerate mutase [bacterium]|nr:2,3-bisphosphoglycerate-independent phosphoglycerate mutase [bacterium]
MSSNPVVLIIMDGWGVAAPSKGNAFTLAQTPFLEYMLENYPAMLLEAGGVSVGLPWGEMGNSEVGHLSIGAGKIVFQSLARVTKAIESGEFFKNRAFQMAIEHVKKNKSNLHLMGLLGTGGVHAHQLHIESLMQLAQDQGVPDVYLHLFLDGRDAPQKSADKFLTSLIERMREKKYGQIASLSGRFWAMDRDQKWERTEKSYHAIVHGQSESMSDDVFVSLYDSYERKIYDEEFAPTVITKDGKPLAPIQDNDAVIFYNFRTDRPRQLTEAFVADEFAHFDRGKKLENLLFVTMTEYKKDWPVQVAFPPEYVREPLAKTISDAGKKQLHVAETEKYAHVTFFINGLQEKRFPGEDRVLVPSPLVDSYAKTPEMSGEKVAKAVVEGIQKDEYSFIVVNFANPDMVAHTGNLQATIRGLEADDRYLESIVTAALEKNGTVLITSDHGNCEELVKLQTGEMDKEHSSRPVPLLLINQQFKGKYPPVARDRMYTLQSRGTLVDVAPTVLGLLGIEKPREMVGINLLKLIG